MRVHTMPAFLMKNNFDFDRGTCPKELFNLIQKLFGPLSDSEYQDAKQAAFKYVEKHDLYHCNLVFLDVAEYDVIDVIALSGYVRDNDNEMYRWTMDRPYTYMGLPFFQDGEFKQENFSEVFARIRSMCTRVVTDGDW